MIPEYKLYHGAVFSELIDAFPGALTIQRYRGRGERRGLNYVVNGNAIVQIRHATQRLSPWAFAFTSAQWTVLRRLKRRYDRVFLVLVCHTDGMVCIPFSEALSSFSTVAGTQCWLRVDRRKRKQYRVYGPAGEFPHRYPSGVESIIQELLEATGE